MYIGDTSQIKKYIIRSKDNRMMHPVDKYVGIRLRTRRQILGLSQQDIGERVGITFQQLQKYEKGINRISISRLYEFSQILGVPIEWFVEGFEDYNAIESDSNVALINNQEAATLLKVYFSVPAIIRKKILSLLKSIANEKEWHNAPPESSPSKRDKERHGILSDLHHMEYIE